MEEEQEVEQQVEPKLDEGEMDELAAEDDIEDDEGDEEEQERKQKFGDEEEEEEDSEEQEEEEEEDKRSLFEQLFDGYQRVNSLLMEEGGMDEVTDEYEKLFKAAKDWHIQCDELEERCSKLERQLNTCKFQTEECSLKRLRMREEIQELHDEVAMTKRLADTAHEREQNTVGVMVGLRNKLAILSKELDHKARLATEAADRKESVVVPRGATLDLEFERVATELALVQERLERSVGFSRKVEQMINERGEEVEKLKRTVEEETMERQKEKMLKERLMTEITASKIELEQKQQHVQILTQQNEKHARELRIVQNKYRELKIKTENLAKDNAVLVARNSKLQHDMRDNEAAVQSMRRETKQRTLDLKDLWIEIRHYRKDVAMAERQRVAETRKAEVAVTGRLDAEKEVVRLRNHVVASLENDLRLARDSALLDNRAIERLNRDKEMLTKTLDHCQDVSNEQVQTMRLQDQAHRAIADELDVHVVAARKQRKQINGLKMDRDRLTGQTTELEMRVQEALEEVRLKQMEIYESKRRVEESVSRYRQQQNLYDAMREDRNSFAKQLIESKDEINELRHKLKVQSHHVEQIKEDVSSKEVELRRANKILDKMEKEKDKLRHVLEAAKNEMFPGRAQVVAAAAALARERCLMSLIDECEGERRHMMSEIQQLIDERDILGSQLVRRNDEVSLLYEKIHLLQTAMRGGEAQYNQRVDDIRLLKAEVCRLRNEKEMLKHFVENMAHLRKEVFHLHRDLTRERVRACALEEELQNPLNIHRWRTLKGTNPSAYELVEKVQLLQKRLLAQGADAIERERHLQQAQCLYANLRQVLERQRPDVAIALVRTQQALRQRGKKMKVLAAEASLYEAEREECQSALQQEECTTTLLRRENLRLRKASYRLKTAADAARGQLSALQEQAASCLRVQCPSAETLRSACRFMGTPGSAPTVVPLRLPARPGAEAQRRAAMRSSVRASLNATAVAATRGFPPFPVVRRPSPRPATTTTTTRRKTAPTNKAKKGYAKSPSLRPLTSI